jgi:hypothetical protein
MSSVMVGEGGVERPSIGFAWGEGWSYRELEASAVDPYPSCIEAPSMLPTLTAEDLWPLVLKLPHEEQVRLARLALRAAAGGEAYRVSPPARDEFSSEEEPLAWEARGLGRVRRVAVRSGGTHSTRLTSVDLSCSSRATRSSWRERSLPGERRAL